MSTMSPTGTAIRADALVKTYPGGKAPVRALDGVSLEVPAGSIFALLGPNGAGKSTTVRILTTLSRPDSGTAEVAGHPVDTSAHLVRREIGYVAQGPCFDPVGTGTENLVFQGRVHGLTAGRARARARVLLEQFGLAEAAGRLTGKWSGGMQRKLDVAMGLVHQPRVLFLDEPTTGLDPEARAEMWQEIAGLTRATGLTVLLTTHYLEEADRLADRVAIIDHGRVVAAGSPETLKAELRGEAIALELPDPASALRAGSVLDDLPGVTEVTTDGQLVRTRVDRGAAALPAVLAALERHGLEPTEVTVSRPSLDDVYLRHAGRSLRGPTGAEQVPAELAR